MSHPTGKAWAKRYLLIYFKPLHSRNSLPVRKIKKGHEYKRWHVNDTPCATGVSFKVWVLGVASHTPSAEPNARTCFYLAETSDSFATE